jgi:hypothetical protein
VGSDGKVGMVGEGGRLAKELVVGVFGVLDGRGPGSTERTGKFLKIVASLRVSRVVVATRLLPGSSMGTEGNCSSSSSSNSSIEGKVWENSVRLYEDVCGDEDGEDVGDGGPRLDKGTSACGEGAVEFEVEAEGKVRFDDADTDAEERLGLEKRFRMVSGDIGGVGGILISREKRLVVLTDRPASWRDRMRSAMLPPGLWSVPFILPLL